MFTVARLDTLDPTPCRGFLRSLDTVKHQIAKDWLDYEVKSPVRASV